MVMMLLLAGVALGLQFVEVFIRPLVVPLQVFVVCPYDVPFIDVKNNRIKKHWKTVDFIFRTILTQKIFFV
jgi:hypothetical protein